MDRSLSRRAWFGVAGAATVATLAACGSTKTSSAPTVTVTVPESLTIPPESARSVITDPQVALDRLMAGNQRFVDAQMQHPDQDPDHRLKLSSQGQQPFATILTCFGIDGCRPSCCSIRVLATCSWRGSPATSSTPHCWTVEYAVGHLENSADRGDRSREMRARWQATLESIQHHQTPHGDIAALVTAITPLSRWPNSVRGICWTIRSAPMPRNRRTRSKNRPS